jgi:hypothetical protein
VLADLKAWLNIQTKTEDTLLQNLITRGLLQMLRWMNRDHIIATANTENRDGNDAIFILPRNFPLISVSSLTVNGIGNSAASDQVSSGFVFDSRKIMLRGGSSSFYSLGPYSSQYEYRLLQIDGDDRISRLIYDLNILKSAREGRSRMPAGRGWICIWQSRPKHLNGSLVAHDHFVFFSDFSVSSRLSGPSRALSHASAAFPSEGGSLLRSSSTMGNPATSCLSLRANFLRRSNGIESPSTAAVHEPVSDLTIRSASSRSIVVTTS